MSKVSLVFRTTVNVFGLAEMGELVGQMFNLAQMLNRIPNAQFGTSAPNVIGSGFPQSA
jgi:hypothetical protein